MRYAVATGTHLSCILGNETLRRGLLHSKQVAGQIRNLNCHLGPQLVPSYVFICKISNVEKRTDDKQDMYVTLQVVLLNKNNSKKGLI